jgi:carboxypeptidase-like protein
MKTVSYLVVFLLFTVFAHSQDQLEGRIVNEDNQSIPFASVGIKGKRAGIVSDSAGKFKLNLPAFVKPGDSVIISCIGFQPLRTTVKKAVERQQFVLQSLPKNLPEVTLNSFMSSATIGSNNGEFTFYRGWFEQKTGGEIGREIVIPHKKFKLDKIFFKADNTCDTCWIRLHIRKMKGDLPGDELLSDNIIVPFSKLNYADQPAFDLTEYNVILSEKRIFIGFEVLSCSNTESKTSSLCFIGTEYGNYLYKSYSTSQWEDGPFYNIDISVFLKY